MCWGRCNSSPGMVLCHPLRGACRLPFRAWAHTLLLQCLAVRCAPFDGSTSCDTVCYITMDAAAMHGWDALLLRLPALVLLQLMLVCTAAAVVLNAVCAGRATCATACCCWCCFGQMLHDAPGSAAWRLASTNHSRMAVPYSSGAGFTIAAHAICRTTSAAPNSIISSPMVPSSG